MKLGKDTKDQLYIQWHQAKGHYKRAWIQRKGPGTGNDWASSNRYLNVVRCNDEGKPSGNPTDFPIFSDHLDDEQILRAFVHATSAITGCRLDSEIIDVTETQLPTQTKTT